MRVAWTDYGRNSRRPESSYITKLLARKPADTLGDDGANPALAGEPVSHGAGRHGQGPRQLGLPARAVEPFADHAEFGGGHAAFSPATAVNVRWHLPGPGCTVMWSKPIFSPNRCHARF